MIVFNLMILSALHQDGAPKARVLDETNESWACSLVVPEASDTTLGHDGHHPCYGYDPGHCPPPPVMT